MTMLTHGRERFEPAAYSSGARTTAETRTANAHLATIKRFCMFALAMLAIGGVATAVVALRAALYFWRFHS